LTHIFEDIAEPFVVHRAHLKCLQRGLFERHKVLFALMLTNKILVSSGKVKASDVDVLLKGGGALDIASVSEPPDVYIASS